jgi:hypothetical protein
MSEEMVVQLPGLPILEADLIKLGQEKTEVYEVIIPLDRAGLLVFMTPSREGIRVVQGDEYTAQKKDEDDKILLFLQYGTALVLPATTHYTTMHRTSMTGGLHIKTLVTVSLKKFATNGREVRPLVTTLPLGNIAVGYGGPVGIRIPKNKRDSICAKEARRTLAYDEYAGLNGQFGIHLLHTYEDEKYIFPRLFSQYCLPAKFEKSDNKKNSSKLNNTASKKSTGGNNEGMAGGGNVDVTGAA